MRSDTQNKQGCNKEKGKAREQPNLEDHTQNKREQVETGKAYEQPNHKVTKKKRARIK
jgi:hypothetical protein